ncbi:MAG: TetR family transcriptional regulator [Dehalococcoidia bacterium]|nr:MAG: TetR family transcriptional regulator [Dehalococcoidia bacterium]
MPAKRERAQETRRRIIEQAARAIRAEGIERVGVGELMGRLGLTHGGFYAHFSSKEALAAEAIAAALAEQCEHLLAASEAGPAALVDVYLSRAHRDQPEQGCPLPAVAPEVVHGSEQLRHAFTEALRGYAARLAGRLPGEDPAAREETALALLSGMCGALLISRAVDDSALADRILSAARAAWHRLLAQPIGVQSSTRTPSGSET